MKARSLRPKSSSGAKIIVRGGGHQATAPADGLVPLELKLKRILVPYDFSHHSEKALRHALAIAHQFGAEILLANIVEVSAYPVEYTLLPVEVFGPQRQEEHLTELKKITDGLEVKATPIVRIGCPWEELVNIAEREAVDLIVIATHGRTGLSRVLVGSVAERVIQHAPCPVLVIRIPKDARKSRRQKRAAAKRF